MVGVKKTEKIQSSINISVNDKDKKRAALFSESSPER